MPIFILVNNVSLQHIAVGISFLSLPSPNLTSVFEATTLAVNICNRLRVLHLNSGIDVLGLDCRNIRF